MAKKTGWSAVPAQRSNAMELNTRRKILLTLVIIAIVSGPLSLVLSLRSAPVPVTPVIQVSDPSSALASIVAQDFIAGRATLVPFATSGGAEFSGVNPNLRPATSELEAVYPLGVLSFAYAGFSNYSLGGRDFKIHSFLLETKSSILKLGVVTTLDANGQPVLAAQPSIMPNEAVLAPSVSPVDFSGALSEIKSIPAGFDAQMLKWATAFASDDRVALKELVNAPGVFTGLGGFMLEGTPQIITVLSDTTSGLLNVRVRVNLVSITAPGFTAISDYDLLVKPEGDLPKIIAWGVAGTTALPLTPFYNRTAP